MSKLKGAKYQTLFSPLVFFAQLIFTFLCKQDLSPHEFKTILLIVNLSLLLQFSDLGALFSTYLLASEFFKVRSNKNYVKLINSFKYTCAVSLFGLITIFLFWQIKILNIQIAIFIGLSMLNQIIAWFNIVNRAGGKEFLYSAVFNLSWPLTLALTVTCRVLDVSPSNYYLLPILASLILNCSVVASTIYTIKLIKPQIDLHQENNCFYKVLTRLVCISFLIQTTNSLNLYLDKYLLDLNSEVATVNKYLICTQVVFGLITLINTLYSTHAHFTYGKQKTELQISTDFIKYTLFLICLNPIITGFLITIIYRSDVDTTMMILTEIVIIMYSILKRVQIYFSDIYSLKIQIIGNIHQLIAFPLLYFFLFRMPHEYSIMIAFIIAVMINLSYLVSKFFELER